jgi:O-antigen/teichoic acid export membrane protein
VRLGRDVFSGLMLSLGSMVVSLAVVPFYIAYLGVEAYGLIGFFAALQGVLAALDLGLSPTVNREVARLDAIGEFGAARDLLRTIEVVYGLLSLVIFALVAAVASLIARDWLQAEHLPMPVVARAVLLMGGIVAARWPTSLYLGVLMGARRLMLANSIMLGGSLLGSLGALAVLAFVSRTIDAFFWWQGAVGLALTVILRVIAWRALGGARGAQFDQPTLKRIWRFSAGMSGVALTAIIFGQLDKVVLSKVVPLREFGYYALATTVASGLYRLITPVFNAIYPRFTAFAARGDELGLAGAYEIASNLFACLYFPASLLLAVSAEPLVRLWTGNAEVTATVAPLVTILTLGSAIHGVMYFPYALQLAHGDARMPLKINLILLVAMVPIIVGFSLRLGVIGGALAWLVLHSLYFPLGTWLTHRRYLVGAARRWASRDIGVPAMLSLTFGLVAWGVTRHLISTWAQLGVGALAAVLALTASFALSQFNRREFRQALVA